MNIFQEVFIRKFRVNYKAIVFSNEKIGTKKSTIKIGNNQWKELVFFANKIKFKQFSSLKAPS